MLSPKFKLLDKNSNNFAEEENKNPDSKFVDDIASVIKNSINQFDKLLSHGGPLLAAAAGSLYLFSELLLNADEKIEFSKWTNLQISIWDEEHKKSFAIAGLHYLFEMKQKGEKIPDPYTNALININLEMLPPLVSPLNERIIGFYKRIFSPQTRKEIVNVATVCDCGYDEDFIQIKVEIDTLNKKMTIFGNLVVCDACGNTFYSETKLNSYTCKCGNKANFFTNFSDTITCPECKQKNLNLFVPIIKGINDQYIS
jgi:hypothetical protein